MTQPQPPDDSPVPQPLAASDPTAAFAAPLDPVPEPADAPFPQPALTLDELEGVPPEPGETQLASPVAADQGWMAPVPPPPPVAHEYAPTSPPPEPYPMVYEVAYRERLSRLSTFLRLPLLLPVYVFDAILGYLLGIAMFAGWITVLLRKKYPAWLFTAATGVLGFQSRYHAYAELLTDQFPSFDREKSTVLLQYDAPPDGSLARWRVFFWKFFLLIPHFVVLSFIVVAAFFVIVLAWFAILFTGNYPRGMFNFVTGVNRWWYRMVGYFAGFNDRFPPYALSPIAGPASRSTSTVSGAIGWAGGGLLIGGITAAAIFIDQSGTTNVTYAQLKQGRSDAAIFIQGPKDDPEFELRLVRVTDPDAAFARTFGTPSDEHSVVFELRLSNNTGESVPISRTRASLDYREEDGDERTQEVGLVLVEGRPAPRRVGGGQDGVIKLVFSLPQGATPTQLNLDAPWNDLRPIHYRFK